MPEHGVPPSSDLVGHWFVRSLLVRSLLVRSLLVRSLLGGLARGTWAMRMKKALYRVRGFLLVVIAVVLGLRRQGGLALCPVCAAA